MTEVEPNDRSMMKIQDDVDILEFNDKAKGLHQLKKSETLEISQNLQYEDLLSFDGISVINTSVINQPSAKVVKSDNNHSSVNLTS